ncbi:MAG: KpsF/GutQ family sugar-phosphate isomerase [Nostocales cyanobacterium 94392]|nr:KpsF/GutQ family sugar-phosphate isomerase [Nostocales cyanobacterium 94392]
MHSFITSVPVNQVIELLKLEATAINQAAERLQINQLEKALNLLINCQGKVVLTGVGKSGIVAQKIAATLCSIGTVAVCLHPCDALHGDLGIITASDVVVLFSNSGETQELIEIVPHLKHRQVPIIGILGNLHSTLAARVDIVLDASVDREACPLNLAPTTSTTVALAIGDALSMTLMQMRSITPQDFALNHPAGRLGKRLTLKVADLMHQQQDNPVIRLKASWIEIVSAITKGGLGAVNVIDQKGQLLGIITDGDLRRSIATIKPADIEHLQAATIMTRNPVTVQPNQLAYDALQLMENRSSQISVLPVVDEEGYCIGLIRLHDIARSGIL